MGFYNWLHDFLFHLLSAPKSCWPDAARPPMAKASKKHGGVRPSGQIETMALAGIMASGYDNLRSWERRFLRIVDEYEAGAISSPELYAKLAMYVKRTPWDYYKYYRTKKKLEKKVVRLRHGKIRAAGRKVLRNHS